MADVFHYTCVLQLPHRPHPIWKIYIMCVFVSNACQTSTFNPELHSVTFFLSPMPTFSTLQYVHGKYNQIGEKSWL